MYLGAVTESKDNLKWRCRVCKTTCSLHYATLFKASILSLPSLLQSLYYWSEDIQPREFLEKQLNGPNTFVDWKSFMRDDCIEDPIINQGTISGPEAMVKIDESKFGDNNIIVVDYSLVNGFSLYLNKAR
ncbi:hypothetical protein LOD99_6380 [Oopsacas minuta]|uniref:Uncharacterized protein n=1 Tax=Oopsacas minuta TaxID=111878 RepID=A0AAV7JLP2_9METZ|nr:hypothetical protein LOD99_6380 [Oopsacas minuta]